MKKLSIIIVLAMAAGFVYGAGISGAPVLDMYSGARPAAMAGVCGATGGLDAAWYNPAGMADIKKSGAGLTYFADAAGLMNMFANIGFSFGQAGALEVSAAYSGAGTVDNALEEAGVDAYDMAASLGYGMQLGSQFKAGLTVKYLNSKLGSFTASSFSGSAGLSFDINDIFKTALCVKNIGQGLKYSEETTPLPLTAVLSGGARAIRAGDHALDCNVDVNYSVYDKSVSAGASLEYAYMSALFVRCGYMYEEKNLSGFGAGLGMKMPVKWGELSVDYAFAPVSLGTTYEIRHLITVTAGF